MQRVWLSINIDFFKGPVWNLKYSIYICSVHSIYLSPKRWQDFINHHKIFHKKDLVEVHPSPSARGTVVNLCHNNFLYFVKTSAVNVSYLQFPLLPSISTVDLNPTLDINIKIKSFNERIKGSMRHRSKRGLKEMFVALCSLLLRWKS